MFIFKPWSTDLSHSINEPQTYLLEKPFLARYLRVYPLLEYDKVSACLKLEILGCREAGALSFYFQFKRN